MNALQRLNTLHPDIISDFLEVGESSAIPKDVQLFIMQISWANEIYTYERNITRAAKKLKHRILSTQGVRLSERACRERINDALNFFYVDSNVSSAAWDMQTADRLQDYAKLEALNNNGKAAGHLEERANFYRQRATAESQNTGSKVINFLISKDIKDSDLGFTSKSLKEIAKKANEGYYIGLINGLPIEKEQKKALFRDADIVDYEEITSDE